MSEIAKANEELDEAVRHRVKAGHTAALRSLKAIAEYVPDIGFTGSDKMAKVYGKPKDDCSFFTETYLYALMGKKDAITIMALLTTLAKDLGCKHGMYELTQKEIT